MRAFSSSFSALATVLASPSASAMLRCARLMMRPSFCRSKNLTLWYLVPFFFSRLRLSAAARSVSSAATRRWVVMRSDGSRFSYCQLLCLPGKRAPCQSLASLASDAHHLPGSGRWISVSKRHPPGKAGDRTPGHTSAPPPPLVWFAKLGGPPMRIVPTLRRRRFADRRLALSLLTPGSPSGARCSKGRVLYRGPEEDPALAFAFVRAFLCWWRSAGMVDEVGAMSTPDLGPQSEILIWVAIMTCLATSTL